MLDFNDDVRILTIFSPENDDVYFAIPGVGVSYHLSLFFFEYLDLVG